MLTQEYAVKIFVVSLVHLSVPVPMPFEYCSITEFLITSFLPFLKYNIFSRVFSFIVRYKTCNKKLLEDLTEILMGIASIDHFMELMYL